MTAGIPETRGSAGPWQRYVEAERSARAGYLAVTEQAHREYLIGPWPDRDSYLVVERQAWMTYHAAGRQAWKRYAADMTALASDASRPYRNPPTNPIFDQVSAGRPGSGPAPRFHPDTEDGA